MRVMTGRVVGVLGAVGLALSFSSCGNSSNPSGGGAPLEATVPREAGPPREHVAGGGCGTASNPIMVGIGGALAYSPSSCTVTAGQTVVWRWATGPHSVTAYRGASFDAGQLAGGSQFTFTVPSGTAAGTIIGFHCTVPGHSSVAGNTCTGMCGSLTVQ
jgi:plastocyanin